MVLFFALGAGGALGYWLNQQHAVIGSASGVRQLTGIRVAVVGGAFPTRSSRETRVQVRRFGWALGALFAAFVLAVVLSHLGVRLGSHATRTEVHAA